MSDLPGNAAARPAKIEIWRVMSAKPLRSPWRLRVDGQHLLTPTGRNRHFGSPDEARRAALKSLKSGAAK